jgi:protein SCO1/2
MARFLPLAALACSALVACGGTAPLHGTVFSPAQTAKRFTLVDQSGLPFTLAAPRAQITVVYFGFTHCKDVCPQTLSKLSRARERSGLTPQRLLIVMVTVDPARDNPAEMRAFFARLHVQAIGLTASKTRLQPVYRAYGVAVEKMPHDIGHSDYIYVLDQQGGTRELLPSDVAVDALADDLRTLVK